MRKRVLLELRIFAIALLPWLASGVVSVGAASAQLPDGGRTVFVEVFGFSTAPYCPPARDGAQQLLDVYGSANVTWLDWHMAGQFETPDGDQRANLYGVGGVPDVYFDGVDHVVGGGGDMFPVYEPIYLDHQTNLPPGAFIESALFVSPPSTTATLRIIVAAIAPEVDPSEYRILAALMETVDYEGETWRNLARGIVVDIPLATGTYTHTVELVASTLPPSGPPAGFGAVAWIQRESDMSVLNACQAVIDAPVGVESMSWGRIRSLYRE